MEELFDQQVVTEQYEEQAASPWPCENPATIEDTERQIRLRLRVAEHLEAQRRLEAEIARQAEEQRVREEQKRLEEERKKLEAEVKEEKEKGVGDWDPILISLVRRAMPNLLAYDICGVQPMSGPTGLIFAMRSKYEKEGAEKPAVLKQKEPVGSWGEYQDYYGTRTVNSATRKKQAEEAAKQREEMRQEYLKRRKGWPVILESKEAPLDESKKSETISESLREKWSKIINGTENW